MAQTPTQIPFDLRLAPNYSRAAFQPAPSNAEALAAIDKTASWPNRTLAISGPQGTGKTHLGHIWTTEQGENGAIIATDLELAELGALRGKSVWMDDADRADEGVLFALINMAILGDIEALLLCSRVLPAQWDVQIPDLRSRLGAMTVARIDPPGDDLLRKIYVNLLAERGRTPDDAVIDYLVNYGQRSAQAAQDTAAALDRMAAAKKSKITKALARVYFESQGELF